MTVRLVAPSRALLDRYTAALEAGWSPNTTRDVSGEQLASIRRDPDGFLADLLDPDGTVTLGDGRVVPRLPFRLFWLSDGDFCGVINLRFQEGSEELPDYCSGHIGYAVVPWKRQRGYATAALREVLRVVPKVGLRFVIVTCDADNEASRKVITANGGALVGREPNADHPGRERLVFRIDMRA